MPIPVFSKLQSYLTVTKLATIEFSDNPDGQ